MAENHPVGFQWVMEAKRRGAQRHPRRPALHAHERDRRHPRPDPRGQRHRVPRRRHQLRPAERARVPRVRRRLHERGDDHLRGLPGHRGPRRPVPRLGRRGRTYDPSSWQYEGMEVNAAAGNREMGTIHGERRTARTARGCEPASRRRRDETLAAPALRLPGAASATSRATRPRWSQQICGVPAGASSSRSAEALCENSGRERTSGLLLRRRLDAAHDGVQYIRTAAILQLLLGNIGRPGGGIMALRGHASIQGSTDIPTLYNILPGYLPMPQRRAAHDDARRLLRAQHAARRLLGPHARLHRLAAEGVVRRRGHRGERLLLRPPAAHRPATTRSTRRAWGCATATSRASSSWARTRPSASANGRLHRLALANLKWLVVRDFVEIETASFWRDGPEIETGELRTEDIGTEVFFLPAATHVEKDGHVHEHPAAAAVARPGRRAAGDCRSDLWFMHHLRPARHASGSADSDRRARPRDPGPHLGLPRAGPARRPRRRGGAARDQRLRRPTARRARAVHGAQGRRLDDVAAAGSTAGVLRRRGQPGRRAASPAGSRRWVAPEWGWAWPLNRRILYNRASADPTGKPWSERKRSCGGTRRRASGPGDDVPDFKPDMAARLRPAARATPGRTALRGDEPVHHAGRRQGLAVRAQPGCSTGRCRRTTSRRSRRSATRSTAASRPTRRASSSSARATATTRRTASRAPTSSPSCSRPTGSPSTTRPAACRAGCPTWPSSSPRCSSEVSPELAAERGPGARRLGDDRHVAQRDRGARDGHRAHDAAARSARARRRAPGRPALPLGLGGHRDGRLGQRPAPRRRSTPTCTSASTRRRRATCGPGRRPRGPGPPRAASTPTAPSDG